MTYSDKDQEIKDLKKKIILQEKTITNLYAKYMTLKQQTTGAVIPKFNAGQQVWVIVNDFGTYPKIIKDKIKEIRICKDGVIKYILENYITSHIYISEQKAKTALKELLKGNKPYV